MNSRRVLWDKPAVEAFKKIYNRIKEDSPTAADKVRDGILKTIRSLIVRPEKYPPDKLKIDNEGSFRAFEKYSYRVTYKITDEEIVVLRIRHVKQEPREY